MKLSIRSLAALAVLSLVLAACNSNDNSSRGTSAANIGPKQPAPVNLNAGASITQDTTIQHGSLESARRISVNDLKRELDKGQAIVVDVRSPASYQAGHIKGAISIPSEEFGRRMNELPKGKMIVTYCS